MWVEHERQFIVPALADVPGLRPGDGCELIVQGYLAMHGGAALRLRRRVGFHGDTRDFVFEARPTLEYKGPRLNATRIENEWDVGDEALASALMDMALGVVQKYRYSVTTPAGLCEVDEFLFLNHGLVIAEFESEHRIASFDRPRWCGEEVTSLRAFDNEQLAVRPLAQWHADELRKHGLTYTG